MQWLVAALVTIRIYNYAGASSAEIAGARAGADRIFADAGITLSWIDCRVPGAAGGAACAGPLRDGELVLRLIESAARSTPRRIALGESLVDSKNGGGVLMTIDHRLVGTVARGAGAEPSLVLGRAVAHEIGHLLMGVPGHSRAGLMRALWSQRELRRDAPEDWRFSADQAELMRRGIARSLRAAN